MPNNNNNFIVGLDIGTTKICAIVGQLTENRKINILGMGKSTNQGGVSRGMVVNVSKAVEAIREAVDEAERKSSVKIKTVYVGIAGNHIKSIQHRGTLTRKQGEEEIEQSELDRLENEMQNIALAPGLEILHVLPQEYKIDGEDGIREPVGRIGVRVECNYHIITGETAAARTIARTVNRAGLNMAELVVEPVASAAAVLSNEEMEAGIALVDIGGGTTDVCIFHKGYICHTAVIPIGGERITKDIQEAFGILKSQAEEVKIKCGSCYPVEKMKNEIIVIPGLPGRQPKEISMFAIAQVINARVEDIIQKVDFEIQMAGLSNKLTMGITLTGGGASLKDITQLFSFHTGMETHVGSPGQYLGKGFVDEVRHPMYSTVIGLTMLGFDAIDKGHSYTEANVLVNKQEQHEQPTNNEEPEVVAENKKSTFWNNLKVPVGGLFGTISNVKDWLTEEDDFK